MKKDEGYNHVARIVIQRFWKRGDTTATDTGADHVARVVRRSGWRRGGIMINEK